MVGWFQNNWPELLVVGIPAAVGLGALWWYRRSNRTSLLAAVVGFTFLAAAALGGALWAAGVPQAVFGDSLPLKEPDAVWKVTQSVTLAFGAIGVVAASVITYHRQRTSQGQLDLERRTRQHERYAKGSEMLADESLAVRIAGLNVIAALGREVPVDDELRQTCLNLICAYLRVASPLPTNDEDEGERNPPNDGYREVTAEACRLLPTLLNWSSSSDSSEPTLELDVRSTNLFDLDLHARRIGPARLDGAVLTGANLNGADLTGADLTGATLTRATLERANLTGADLTRANLERANLKDANLTGADLTRATLERANLEDANLRGAQMHGANLTRATLERANLDDANLKDANLTRTDLTRAYLEGANLIGANLKDANLTRADLTRAYLEGANLNGATLTYANLTRADLTRADLTRATLTRATLQGANLTGATLTRATLQGANLTRATLTSANLNGTNLTLTDLNSAKWFGMYGIIYDDETQWPDGFTPPNPGRIDR